MDEVTAGRSALAVAAAASLGAGAVHAAAIGAHAEHPQVVKVFSVLAILQIGWGAVALAKRGRAVSAVGAVLGGAAVVGWIMAKTSGIGFIDGLEVAEPVRWADALCATLAFVVGVGAATSFALAKRPITGATVGLRRASTGLTAVIGVLALTGMTSAANHHHSGATDVHVTGDVAAAGAAHPHNHGGTPAVATVPYDPTKPIDLGGVAGVTPQEQARAENLVADTIIHLPQFADWTTLESKGFYSIHDAMTGDEHYVNWSYIDDGRILDPDHPESLVFEMINGKKTLVSAMFMAEKGTTLDNVPDIGGKLTQWHIHNNLCYTMTDPPAIIGLTNFDGSCSPGSRTLGDPRPMIHVWIRPNECGPFAALDGVGAGQVKAGETKACDTAHGGHSN